jgi:hypothetical protein
MKSINNTNRAYVTRNFSNFDLEENENSIDEAFDFLKGKARLYGDVEQAVTDAGTLFDTYMDSPNQKEAAESAKSKTDKVLTDLKAKKQKEHERSDYRGFLDDIEKAVSEFKKNQDSILSKIKKYADVAKIISEASEMAKEAAKKATDAKMEISKKKSERDTKLKDAIKLSKTLKKDETKGKNEEIHDIQKEFIRKFKNNSKIKDSEIFKKIKNAVEVKKEGGFFGSTTERIIKGLKAGFGMEDESSDITQELIDKIYTEKIEESNGFRVIKGFSNFDVMNEDFDADKFLEVVASSDKDKKDKDKKVKVSVDKVKEEMKKASDKSYEENKEGIDYMMDKMFTPSIDGKDLFKTLFLKSWDDFTKLDDDEKKKFLSINFKNHDSLQPADKSKIDLFFKKGNSSPKVDSSLDDK